MKPGSMYSKFFDNKWPLPHHIHHNDDFAKLTGQLGKPEAYYFPPQVNNHGGDFPYTFFGLEPYALHAIRYGRACLISKKAIIKLQACQRHIVWMSQQDGMFRLSASRPGSICAPMSLKRLQMYLRCISRLPVRKLCRRNWCGRTRPQTRLAI